VLHPQIFTRAREWPSLTSTPPTEQSYKRSCWLTLGRQCAFGVYQCIWVWATWLWCRGNFTPPNFPHSDLGRRADSRWALPQISSFLFFSRRVISELRGPITAKFCTMLLSMFSFIIPGRNFGGASQKIFRGQKHAKFGPISVNFEVRWPISSERMKIFKIGEFLVRHRFLLR